MKPIPRKAEREVAKILSEIYARCGYSPVERIPVLGREGPDIQVNEAKIAIDVKSRIEVPKGISHLHAIMDLASEYIALPICDIAKIHLLRKEYASPRPFIMRVGVPMTVDKWWRHMDEWTSKNLTGGLTALVLRRPGMRFNMSAFVFRNNDLERFQKVFIKLRSKYE